MYIPWKYSQEQAETRDASRDGNFYTPSITVNAAETFESRVTDFLKGQVDEAIYQN